jgi:hypothetical protein
MRKVILSFAALAALSFVVPYAAPAKADAVVIRTHPRHVYNYAPRHDRTVVIRRHVDVVR